MEAKVKLQTPPKEVSTPTVLHYLIELALAVNQNKYRMKLEYNRHSVRIDYLKDGLCLLCASDIAYWDFEANRGRLTIINKGMTSYNDINKWLEAVYEHVGGEQ